MRGQPVSDWLRPFVLLIAGVLFGVFAGITIQSTSVAAADATWSNQSLVYNNQTYAPLTDPQKISAMGIPSGSTVYATAQQGSGAQDVSVVFFPSGTDMTTASTATHSIFSFSPPNNYTQKSTGSITTTPTGDNSSSAPSGCDVPGIGWALCPVTVWMAQGMDWVYDKLSGFLESQPLNVTNTKSGLYIAWDIMRGFANGAFIVVFIIIIYSQITSLGISNYGIKKMLPRLAIAAVLVNISFFICAVAIDLSNITGYALQDLFIQIRNTMTTLGEGNTAAAFSWESMATLILSGGAASGATAVGGFFLLAETGGVASSALILLLPILLGLLLTLLVVLLVLAARQALIVILTIISPLAFVCYLLPGTEKWFEKWRSFFFTMLIFFPAFSAVFGGSQLAGAAIIQNASTVIMAILGLAVQAAPLALAPLILRLSGGVLNRFAGIVNNPNKGLLDRTRNFAKDQSQYLANRRSIGNDNLKRGNFLRRAGRAANFYQRRRKERIDNYQSKADAAYEATQGHADLDRQRREIEHSKQMTQKTLDIKWNTHLKINTKALEKDLKLRVLTDQAELGKMKLDNRYVEFKAGHHPTGAIGPMHPNDPIFKTMQEAQDVTQHVAAQGLRQSNAQRVINQQLAEKMLANRELQVEAGGIYGDLGSDSAVASAISTMRSEYGKSVEEGRQIVKHFNLSAKQRQDHAMGRSFEVIDSKGNKRVFDTTNTFTREAVIEDQVTLGTVNEVREIVAASGSTLAEYKTSISDALAKSGVKSKAPFMGGKLIDDIAKGDIRSGDDLTKYIEDWLAQGKFKPEDIAVTDLQGIGLLKEAVTSNLSGKVTADVRFNLKEKINEALVKDDLRRHMAQNAEDEFRLFRNTL